MDIKLVIGTKCNCPLSFLSENDFGKCCYKEQTIGLGISVNEFTIFEVLNHEVLHAIIEKTTNQKTARLFDRIFQDKRRKVVRFTLDDGTPKF